MQPYWHYHITANNYRDYRPASQAVFSVVYMSVPTVSTNFSVAYQHHIDNSQRRCSRQVSSHIDANNYHDYRLALQAVFSVIYVSYRYQSAWIQ